MSSINGLGSAVSAFLMPQTQNPTGVGASSNAATIGQVSATISGPGQLFSELQQLQAQDPNKFQQVASQIAGQLQSAAQQQGTGNQADFLNKLAGQFNNVANGGDISQLKPHHHGHHGGHKTYNSSGQAVASSPGTSSASGTSVQDLFKTIANEVAQALAGS